MLIASKNKNDKIVQGLLSYAYKDLSIPELQSIIQEYKEDRDIQLYLYRTEDSDNFIGLIVIEYHAAQNETEIPTVLIRQISVVPSFRNEGVGYQMYCELRHLYPQATVIGAMNTMDYVARWSEQYQSEKE